MKRYDENTASCMLSYLDRYLKILKSPMDVITLFNGLTVGQQHHVNRALRALFNFCEIIGFSKIWLDKLRKAIPKDEIGIDLKVPEENEVLSSLRKVPKISMKYQGLWNLCLDSGIRLVEAVNITKDFDLGKIQRVNGFLRYEVGSFRGSKQAYYAYFTEHTLRLIKEVAGEEINSKGASRYFSDVGVTSPKYLRKFSFDKMISLEVPESVADFIEGRVPKRIGAKHYMVLMRQADKFYGRYGEYVTKLRN